MQSRELIKLLRADGWQLKRTREVIINLFIQPGQAQSPCRIRKRIWEKGWSGRFASKPV
jgi:hypothetical protein